MSADNAALSIPPRMQKTVVLQHGADGTQVAVDAPTVGSKSTSKQHFAYDRVFGPTDSQERVYDNVVAPLIDRFIAGYNVTVLAYGQTSSGKSYTMGTDLTSALQYANQSDSDNATAERRGIVPRAVEQIFSALEEKQAQEPGRWSFEAKNSYIEIYNEELIDLLAGDLGPHERPAVTIREDKAGNILWTGLREVVVPTSADVMQNLFDGSQIRQTGQTAMNDQSSRSHAIFSLTLTQKHYTGTLKTPTNSPPSAHTAAFNTPSRIAHRQSMPLSGLQGTPGSVSRVTSPTPSGQGTRPNTPGSAVLRPRPSSIALSAAASRAATPNGEAASAEWTTIVSKFHWVDLAGSERLKRTSAVGDRAKEGISINAGLLALGNVISALGDPAKVRLTTHIPYRDSKLTRLLQDSLGGNAHTLMIACVSPIEYNLGETLNTLKYANRARNIKNRAELNEVEAGWDNVDHLQTLVTRLRTELATFKSIGSMPSILEATENGPISGRSFSSSHSQTVAASELLAIKSEYAELSARYARLTADLVKAQQTTSDVSQNAFTQAVEAVSETYDKSLSALESQLSLTKAALFHSEELIRESEQELETQVTTTQNTQAQVDELNNKLARLSERESKTETYIEDLESQLKGTTEKHEQTLALLGDLRKELSRHREIGEQTEIYVKELEQRLSQNDENVKLQRSKIESLERDIVRREKAHTALEERLVLLDKSEEQKQLVLELDEQERKLQSVHGDLDQARQQIAALERRLEDRQKLAEAHQAERAALQIKCDALETQAARSPKATSPTFVDSTQVTEIDALRTQHENALRVIDDLRSELQNALLNPSHGSSIRIRKTSSNSSAPPSPRPPSHKSANDQEELQDDLAASHTLPHGRRNDTPTKARMRRSMPLSPRGSFFGRSPAQSHSASHLRSLSLSQELLLAQSQNGTSAETPGAISHTDIPPSPRAISPLMLRRSSTTLSVLHASVPPQSERTTESYVQEIRKLQDTLNERDDEIRGLEISLAHVRRTMPLTPDEPDMDDPTPRFVANMHLQTPAVDLTDPFQLSPASLDAFNAIRSSMVNGYSSDGPSSAAGSSEQMQRLDDLMVSFARKESVHKESMQTLQDQLDELRKQYDDLKSLSSDQLHNMSLESQALQKQLIMATSVSTRSGPADSPQTEAVPFPEAVDSGALDVERLQQELAALQRTSLQAEQAASANRDEAAKQLANLLDEHEVALHALELSHAATMQRTVQDHAQAIADLKTAHEAALTLVQTEAAERFQAQADTHAQTLAQMQANQIDVHEASLLLKTEHADAIQKLRAEHSAITADMAQKHEQAVSDLSDRFNDAVQGERNAHAATVAGLRTSHEDALQRLRETTSASLQSVPDDGRTAEVERLQQAVRAAQEAEKHVNEELQEALDALGTLEKALTESHDERERMVDEIRSLQKSVTKPSTLERALQADVTRLQKENLQLSADLAQVQSEQAAAAAQSALQRTASQQGAKHLNTRSEVLLRTSSSSSELEHYVDASGQPPTQQMPSLPNSPPLPPKHSSVVSLMGSTSTYRQAFSPTPPPNIPLPEPPAQSDGSRPGSSLHHSTMRSQGMDRRPSIATSSNARTSMQSITTRESHTQHGEPPSTGRTSGSGDTAISVDARVHARLEEQEAHILRMTKQLQHYETELRANIDLVKTLEGLLTERDRTLRKSRQQQSDLVRERDQYMQQVAQLRQEKRDAEQEVDNARHSLAIHQQESEQRADAQRRAQAEAQRIAEARMAEMQKFSRKSKFNCF